MSDSEPLEPSTAVDGASSPADAGVARDGRQVVGLAEDVPTTVSTDVFDLLIRLAPYAPESNRDRPDLDLGMRLEHVIFHVGGGLGAMWDHEAGLPDFERAYGDQRRVVRGEEVSVFDSDLYARAMDLIDGLDLAEAAALLRAVQAARLAVFGFE